MAILFLYSDSKPFLLLSRQKESLSLFICFVGSSKLLPSKIFTWKLPKSLDVIWMEENYSNVPQYQSRIFIKGKSIIKGRGVLVIWRQVVHPFVFILVSNNLVRILGSSLWYVSLHYALHIVLKEWIDMQTDVHTRPVTW